MIPIFYAFVILIAVGICSGVIFLIYLPFRKRLIKSGKLSKKLDKRINFSYLGFALLISFALFFLNNYTTPSKDRLEAISNVKLLSDFKVIKDEFQDMFTDFALIYEIQFDNQASNELIQSIKVSNFYNAQSDSYHNGAWKDSDLIRANSIWVKSPKGYDFRGRDGGTTYSIRFDTLTNILLYEEYNI